jgi:hypothetical protein
LLEALKGEREKESRTEDLEGVICEETELRESTPRSCHQDCQEYKERKVTCWI